MMSDRSEYRVQIRRSFIIIIRTSYRWICNHPFLLTFIGFLYLLYRTCPLLFSSLLTASPVLICTFILLGTILSFGEPNIPHIDTLHEPPLSTTNAETTERSFTVERYTSKEKGKSVIEEDGLVENLLSEADDDNGPFEYKPLVDETLDEIKREVRFEEKAFDLELEKRGENCEKLRKKIGSFYEMLDESKEDEVDVVSPVSPWRPMRHEDDEDDDGDRDDSESDDDGGESSSPDASMTDIIPMLDELHPLLLSGGLVNGVVNDDEGSDAASEGPHSKSSSSSDDEGMESDVDSDSDSQGEEEEEEKVEEEEEKKDDESKSAIKWTEADQKNVMDLGTLELERNKRLEHLVARRRARHAERNLIDFDTTDIPSNMPSISTVRQNPFDIPDDSYDDMPIPGSAPSIMFARRNPFDIAYEMNEENQGDGVQEELPSQQQPRDAMFRRHESFSVGSSMLGGQRHDRLRPFFVLERLANEGTSYHHPSFERQLSEISESKADTESVCTVVEDDEKKVDEHDDTDRETEVSKVDTVSEHSHSSSDHDDEGKSHLSEDSDSDGQDDSRNLHHDVPEIILGNGETHHGTEGETSDKEELDSTDSDSSLSEIEEDEEEEEEKFQDFSENETEEEVDLHEESGISSQPSFSELEFHVAREGEEDDDDDDEMRGEVSFITAHPPLEESVSHNLPSLVEPPVYDSSPPASRVPSFSSVSSLPEMTEEEKKQENETGTKEVGETSTDVVSREASLLTADDPKKDSLSVSSQEDLEELHEDVKEEVVSIGVVEQHLPVVTTLEESPDVIHDIAEISNRSVADIPIDSYSTLSSGAVEYVETHSFNEEDVPQLVQDPREEIQHNQTMDIEVDSVNSHIVGSDEEGVVGSESDRELTWSDKSVVEQSSLEPGEEDQVPIRPVSVVFSRNITFHEYHDAPEDSTELSSLTSDTSSSSPAGSPEYTTPMVGESSRGAGFFKEDDYDELDHDVVEADLHAISQSRPEVITEEADEIKEIDGGLLSELDTIGDFSVKEVVTDSEPGPSSIRTDTANEVTEALPVLEARSVEDVSEVENVIIPSTVQDLPVVEATLKEHLGTTLNQAVVDSIDTQPKSPEAHGGSGERESAVSTGPSESLVEERSLDETIVPLNNTPGKKEEKEEEEESRPKEITTTIEAHSLEEIPKPSEPEEGTAVEVISERVVIPTEASRSSRVTVTEEARGETLSNAIIPSLEAKETPEISGERIAEQKGKADKKESKSDSSSSSSK